jgi:hypothetical protein
VSVNNLNKLQFQQQVEKLHPRSIDFESRPPQMQIPLREIFPQAVLGLGLGFDLSQLEQSFDSAICELLFLAESVEV